MQFKKIGGPNFYEKYSSNNMHDKNRKITDYSTENLSLLPYISAQK